MVTAGSRATRERWIGLGEASAMLGITPGTLRRWADEGRVPVFTTPGGHRRFSRVAIAAMLPATRTRRPTLARLGASPERVAQAYRARRRPSAAQEPAQAPWVEHLDADARAAFRAHGRELVTALLAYLDADDSTDAATGATATTGTAGAGCSGATERLIEAHRLAATYGRELAELGLSLSDAVEGFLRFRRPFTETLGTIARRRGLDTREATALLAAAEAATDSLLVAVMTGHSLVAGERARGVRRGSRVPDAS